MYKIYENVCPGCYSSDIEIIQSSTDELVMTGDQVDIKKCICNSCGNKFEVLDYYDDEKASEVYDDWY